MGWLRSIVGLLSFLCAFLPAVSGLLEMSELR